MHGVYLNTCNTSDSAVTFIRTNVIGVFLGNAINAISASEIFLLVYKCFGFCHILKGSDNVLVFHIFAQMYPLLKTVTEVVLS